MKGAAYPAVSVALDGSFLGTQLLFSKAEIPNDG